MRALPPILACFGLLLSTAATPGAAGAAADAQCDRDKAYFGCPGDGRIYRDSLVKALDTAERVVIVEHSDPWDLGPSQVDDSSPAPVEYRRVELDSAQRAFFRKTLLKMNPATQNWASACMPVVHHTVRFETAGRVSGTLRICFQCSQVFWDGARVHPPEAIYGALKAVVQNAGLEPERDWGTLAREARDATASSAN
jgi:hypothetical protein